jgi:TonB family protein
MDVTDVLRDRMQTPAGLQRMITVSIGAHVLVAAAILFAPGGWMRRASDDVRPVMTISLAGGGDGPQNGGFTTMGGRPVQQQVAPEDLPKRETPRPPAAVTPAMTVPLPNAKATKPSKTTPAPTPTIKEAPDNSRGKTPTKGTETRAGSTVADTAVRGQGFGLSTGGGAGTGSSLELAGEFCCPEYIGVMVTRIRAAWNQNQGARGMTLIRFTIKRDGSITDATIFKPSGTLTLDEAALRAVLVTRTLPPLPDAYPNPTLTMRLSFEYQ